MYTPKVAQKFLGREGVANRKVYEVPSSTLSLNSKGSQAKMRPVWIPLLLPNEPAESGDRLSAGVQDTQPGFSSKGAL